MFSQYFPHYRPRSRPSPRPRLYFEDERETVQPPSGLLTNLFPGGTHMDGDIICFVQGRIRGEPWGMDLENTVWLLYDKGFLVQYRAEVVPGGTVIFHV